MKSIKLLYIFLMCSMLCVVSCSDNDDEDAEKDMDIIVEDVLSDETTPVTFEFGTYCNHFLFDYTASGKYVGSDTILPNKNKQYTIDLQQGKHQLIWIKGLDLKYGIKFIPENKVFIQDDGHVDDVFYWQKNLNISPYLLPVQKTNYSAVTCSVLFYFTAIPTGPKNVVISNVPDVYEVAMFDNRYKLKDTPRSIIYLFSNNGYSIYGNISLCPQNGLDNIQLQLSYGVTDENGQLQLVTTDAKGLTIPFTPLPKISLRRGYTTKLTGPLLNGNISDWTVEMEPYE